MQLTIKLRRDSAANWTSQNPVLAAGEMGIETDTRKFKFGDGITSWTQLQYASSDAGNIPTKLSDLENDEGFITIEDVATEGYTKNVGTVTSVNNTQPIDGNVTIAIPSEVTETTVTNWGFTKNAGTVTSVNNTQPIDGNVTLSIPSSASDVGALPDNTKYGADLSYNANELQLLDQDGNAIGDPVTISGGASVDISAGENITIEDEYGTKVIDVKDVSDEVTEGVIEGTHYDGFIYYTNPTTTRDKVSLTNRVDKQYGYSYYSLENIPAGSVVHVKLPLFWAISCGIGLVVFTDDNLNVLLNRCYDDTDLGGKPSGDAAASATNWKTGFEPRVSLDEDFTVPEGATRMYVGVRPYGRWETVTYKKAIDRTIDFKSLTDDYMNATTLNEFSVDNSEFVANSKSLSDNLNALNTNTDKIIDALTDEQIITPTSVNDGFLYLGTKGLNTTLTFTASSSYMYNVYDVSEGQYVRIKTKWVSLSPYLPIYVTTDDNNTVKYSKIYDGDANTNQLWDTDEVIRISTGTTKLYVATYKPLNCTPEVSLCTKTSEIEELIATETWDSFFTLVNKVPTKSSSTSTAYRTQIYDVSQLAGQVVRVKTHWFSPSIDIPLIAFTGTSTVLTSMNYKQFTKVANEVIDVDMEITVPTNAKTLYVAVRPEDVSHPEVECQVYTTRQLINIKDLATSVKLLENKESEPAYKIKMGFIGNSLTQDAISYVPWILSRLAPDVDYEFWVYYNGGYTLAQQLEQWNNHGNCNILSTCKKGSFAWTNYNNSKKIEDFLNGCEFDVISMQEYFNNKTTYGAEDLQTYNDCLNYIRNTVSYPFYLVELFHQPHLTQDKEVSGETVHIDIDERFNFMVESTKTMWDNLPIQDIIPTGFASYHATKTDLNNLGDVGGGSPDYTHSQEGLPCQMLAWVVTMWILRYIGHPKGLINDPTPLTTTVYNTINVPGPNIGTGLVTGTEAQYRLAQQVAANALKEAKETFIGGVDAGKYQEKISPDNKLASDLVDDTDNNNKFVTAEEKTTWSAKQPAGDYAENPTVVAIESGDTVVITNNVCYKGSTLTAFSITCPTGTYPFTSQIDFISGTTPTAITYNSTIKWVRGSDDIQENNGVVTFVPVANKEYTIMLYYNGTSWCGVSRGV